MSYIKIKNPTDCSIGKRDRQKSIIIFNELILIMGEAVSGVLNFQCLYVTCTVL